MITLDTNAQRSITDQLRIRIAQVTLSLMVLATLGLAILVLTSDTAEIRQSQPNVIGPLATCIIGLILLLLLRNRRYQQLVLNLTGVYLLLLTINPEYGAVTLFVLAILAVFISALITNRLFFNMIFVVITLRLGANVVGAIVEGANVTDALSAGLLSLFPLLIGVVLRAFINTLQKTATEAQRSAELLEASASIGQVMSKMLDSDQLLNRAVDVIRDRFGFYHAQIYLVDDDQQYAYLKASTGEIGEQLLARQHRLPINAGNVIGRVIQAGEAVVVGDTSTDANEDNANKDLLANTRSELVLPIADGERIIGTLDVQNMRPNAFSNTQIQAMQVMANQLAIAIRNAQLFEDQTRRMNENKRLFYESEINLREIQRLNRQLTRRAWEDYLVGGENVSGVTLSGSEFRPGAHWTERMQQAAQRRRVIQETHGDEQLLAVPIELRGEIVGALEISLGKDADINSSADMLRAIAQRLAISMDNARLFEETQETSAQEQRIGEISTQYQEANNIDDLLQITLRGLCEALGADDGAIRLGGVQATAASQPQNGQSNNHHTDSSNGANR
jgi:GAF domain-containing protein